MFWAPASDTQPLSYFNSFKGDKCMWTSMCKNRHPQVIYKDRHITYAYSFSTSISFSKHQNFKPKLGGFSKVVKV